MSVPPPRTRVVWRIAALLAVGLGGWQVIEEASARIHGSLARFPDDDALAGAALTLFGFTIASINLRWTWRARRLGERTSWPLFVDAITTFAAAPILGLFGWALAGG